MSRMEIIETKGLDSAKPADYNPRKINKQTLQSLKASLERFGDLSGIIKNVTTGNLVGGHQRLKIFGETKNPHFVITEKFDKPNEVGTVARGFVEIEGFGEHYTYREVEWSPEQEKAANYAANKISGEFDPKLAAEITKELWQFDPDLARATGQTDQEIDSLINMVNKEAQGKSEDLDKAPAVDEKQPPKSVLGDIYQLGKHRLMCGDATDFGQLTDLLDGAEVDMVFTDPPYNAAFNGRSGNHEVIKNDDLPEAEFNKLIQETIQNIYTLAPDKPKYICTDWKMYPLLYGLMQKPAACIVWVKNMFGMGKGYRHQHELILFEGDIETNDKSDVWEIKRDNGSEYDHPTQKPVALAKEAIVNSCKRAGNVLDMFGGSGSTLIAADKLERNCYVMELDPKYCDVIRKRFAKLYKRDDWEAFTPKVN